MIDTPLKSVHLCVSQNNTESSTEKLSDNKIEEKWLTTKEAAIYLRITEKCLLNLTSLGKVRYYKFGRRNRFLHSDLKKLLLAEPRGGLYGS